MRIHTLRRLPWLLEQAGGCLYISKLFPLNSSLKKQVNLHCSNIIALKKERTHYFSDVSWSIAPLLETVSKQITCNTVPFL